MIDGHTTSTSKAMLCHHVRIRAIKQANKLIKELRPTYTYKTLATKAYTYKNKFPCCCQRTTLIDMRSTCKLLAGTSTLAATTTAPTALTLSLTASTQGISFRLLNHDGNPSPMHVQPLQRREFPCPASTCCYSTRCACPLSSDSCCYSPKRNIATAYLVIAV